MTYHVHSVEQDLASNWYARVVISEEEAVFLKFKEFPTMEQIQASASQFVEAQRPELVTTTDTILVRARDDSGRFIADDPTTPENEAWVELTNGVTE